MSYIKELLDGNIEQFKNNLESALYAKLASQLGEVKKDVAANIYNEGTCVPCGKKINEAKHDSYEECVKYYIDLDWPPEAARTECGHQKTARKIK